MKYLYTTVFVPIGTLKKTNTINFTIKNLVLLQIKDR